MTTGNETWADLFSLGLYLSATDLNETFYRLAFGSGARPISFLIVRGAKVIAAKSPAPR